MRLSVFMIALVTHAGCSVSELPLESIRANLEGVALDGYSPVSYFTEGRPKRGSAEFGVQHKGVTYWLTDPQQQAVFSSDPEKYIPTHGGWCTLMMAGSGRRTPGHPESFAIVDDRLMLFWSGDSGESKGLGLKNWRSKTGGDLAQERALVKEADSNWRSYLAGEREAPVFLYKPSDAGAVSAAQRAGATAKFD